MGKLFSRYEKKLEKEFSKAETIEEVDALADKYLKKIDRESNLIKGVAVVGGFGVLAYGILRGRIDENLPYIPFYDKFGHFSKGALVSIFTGKLHQVIDRYFDRPEDADDEIMERRKHILERALLETGTTAGAAYAWEYLQKSWPPFPGSQFDYYDMCADVSGHIFNMVSDYYYLAKSTILYNIIMERKEEIEGIEHRKLERVPVVKRKKIRESIL